MRNKFAKISNSKVNIFTIFGGGLFLLGIILLVSANITGIGVLLYQWGKLDLQLGASAWIAFLIWLKMILFGFFSLFLGNSFLSFGNKK